MKQNRSLGISSAIQDALTEGGINLLEGVFPKGTLKNMEPSDIRERVYSPIKTLFTMTTTATMSDKSLKNSVNIHYQFHQQWREQQGQKKAKGKAGLLKYQGANKSLNKDISLNTAAYSKARKRIPMEMVAELFNASRMESVSNDYSHWHGYRVFIGDGTYLQLQDTKELREKYKVVVKGKESQGYPQGLLEGLIERGTGQVFTSRLSNRHVSELALFYDMIEEIPSRSILLLDDLYNSYEIFSMLTAKGIEVVIPAKRKRNYKVIEKIAEKDEIIEIKKPDSHAKWVPKGAAPLAETIHVRRIECLSPEGQPYVLFTTVLDKRISKEELQVLYFSRWDIEISIRELKTIMDINILRSKTEEMIQKELLVSLAAYNIIRQIIQASIEGLPFSPEEDFIYKFYTHHKDVHIDKRGRVYSRWSTGRKRVTEFDTQGDAAQTSTRQELSPENKTRKI